jgi:hypothetical protein
VLVNAIVWVTLAPWTVTLPEAGAAVYPDTVPTVYGYVPFASWNPIVEVVEDRGDPAKVTDQFVPVGRPVAEKVTRKC